MDAYPAKLKYDWIVKARLDGAWAQPAPSVFTFSDDAVSLPAAGFGFNRDVAIIPHHLAVSYFGVVHTVAKWCDVSGPPTDLNGTLAELRKKARLITPAAFDVAGSLLWHHLAKHGTGTQVLPLRVTVYEVVRKLKANAFISDPF